MMTGKTTPKFLAVKNWEKEQPRYKKGFPWIRCYTDIGIDADYIELTFCQRAVLDGCRRLRARLGRNLDNNLVWIVRAISIRPEERHNAVRSLKILIAKKWLIETDLSNHPDTSQTPLSDGSAVAQP